MRQDPAPRSDATNESGDKTPTSDSTDSADADGDGGKPIATTSSDTDADTSTAAGSEKSTRLAKKDDDGAKKEDGAVRKRRFAGPAKKVKAGSDLIRNRIASVVWLIAVLAAVVLAVGALLYALDANMNNTVVETVLDTARKIDGPFWKIFEFDEKLKNGKVVPDETKEHLVNWGLAAVAYLIGGRILDRVIRP